MLLFAFCLCLSCVVVWWRQRSSLAGEALIACCAFNTHALPLAINGGSRALLARSIHAPRHAVHFLLFFCFCAGQLRFVCARMYAYCVLCGVLVAQHRERYLVMFARAPQSFEFLVICWWPWLFLSLDNSKPASLMMAVAAMSSKPVDSAAQTHNRAINVYTHKTIVQNLFRIIGKNAFNRIPLS